MRLERRTTVDAPVDEVWALVRDPSRYPDILDAVEWRACGDGEPGLGAQYYARFPVGSAMIGGRVEIVEYSEPGDLAWNSVTGIGHRGRWRLRSSAGGTEVTLRLAYDMPGGVLGLVAGYAARPFLSRLLRDAVLQLAAAVRRGDAVSHPA